MHALKDISIDLMLNDVILWSRDCIVEHFKEGKV